MSYRVFERSAVRVRAPIVSIVPDGRIALNAAAARIMEVAGVKHVILLWDQAHHRIAIKATTKTDRNGYSLSIARDRHAGTLRARAFTKHIGWVATQRVALPSVWNPREKMFEIALPLHNLAKQHGAVSKRQTKTAL